MLKKDYDRAKERYPEIENVICEELAKLEGYEREGESNIDISCDPFSKILSSIFSSLDSRFEKQLSFFGYNLGRWIFLIDALDDYFEDIKKKRFNIFVNLYGSEASPEMIESAKYNLYASIDGAVSACGLIDFNRNKDIIENIVGIGLYKKTEEILNKKYGSV